MYLEFPHNHDKEFLKSRIDKYASKLNKQEFYSNFKISDLQRNWNNNEMIFSLIIKQGFLERRIKGLLHIKEEVIILEFELPDLIKNFIREDKLKSIINNHVDNILEEVSIAG